MKLKGKHIFLLEDDLLNRAIMTVVLENEGAVVVFDRGGDSSLTSLLTCRQKIDLFLLDLVLPDGRSGYDIADIIRQQDAYRETPIVIVSGSDPNKEVPIAKARGYSGFVAKPIDGPVFTELLLDVFRGELAWPATV